MAVSTGACIEAHLAALEASLEVNDRNKGVTSEPRPEGQNVLPKNLPMRLPRRLPTDKEVAVASEDFDSWKTYLTHGHRWWRWYLGYRSMARTEEEVWEKFGAFTGIHQKDWTIQWHSM